MHSKTSKFSLVALQVVTMLCVSSTTSPAEDRGLKLDVIHEKQMLPYTPLPIRMTISNVSDRDIWWADKDDFMMSVIARVETEAGKLVFEGEPSYDVLEIAMRDRLPGPPILIESGAGWSGNVVLAGTIKQSRIWVMEAIFSEPGLYRISFKYKTAYMVRSGRDKDPQDTFVSVFQEMETPASTVEVVDSNEHAQTLRAVKALPYPAVVVKPGFVSYLDGEGHKKLEKELNLFISEHRNSPWTPAIYNALGWNYYYNLSMQNGRKDKRLLQLALEALERGAKVECWKFSNLTLQLHISEELGLGGKAEELRQLIATEEHARMGTKPEVEPEDEIDPFEYLLQAQARLEADGYDHAALQEVAPEAFEEYYAFETSYFEANMDNENPISLAESYQGIAAALDRIVRANMEPLSQEELRKRIEERQRDFEKRRKLEQEADEFSRHFIERLETGGYDPRGLYELAPGAFEKYTKFVEESIRRERSGEIDFLEYTRIVSGMLEKLVREHTKPFSQEELQERLRVRREEELRKVFGLEDVPVP